MVDEQVFLKQLFGGTIRIAVYDSPKELVEPIVEEMYLEALRLQKIFNFYDKNSELSILNKNRKMVVSDDLAYVIKRALKICNITNGEYDISMGINFLKRKKGESLEIFTGSYKHIILDKNLVEIDNAAVMIDLGSIAKGYITDKLSDFLKNNGVENFVIDSRGDILVSGHFEHIIEIQHPRKKGSISKLKLCNMAVATSGDYSQFDKKFEKSHILNQKEIISVTVIAKGLMEADLYATAIFVSNKEKIKELLMNQDISAMVIYKDLIIKTYKGFKENQYG